VDELRSSVSLGAVKGKTFDMVQTKVRQLMGRKGAKLENYEFVVKE
jgi:hypothetical protein